MLGWNAENEAAGRQPALPVYLTDDASGNLYIQSGRADVFFGPQSVAAYKAALSGKTKVVGLGPKKRTLPRRPKGQRHGGGAAGGAKWRDCSRGIPEGAGALGRAGRRGDAIDGESAGDNLLKTAVSQECDANSGANPRRGVKSGGARGQRQTIQRPDDKQIGEQPPVRPWSRRTGWRNQTSGCWR